MQATPIQLNSGVQITVDASWWPTVGRVTANQAFDFRNTCSSEKGERPSHPTLWRYATFDIKVRMPQSKSDIQQQALDLRNSPSSSNHTRVHILYPINRPRLLRCTCGAGCRVLLHLFWKIGSVVCGPGVANLLFDLFLKLHPE